MTIQPSLDGAFSRLFAASMGRYSPYVNSQQQAPQGSCWIVASLSFLYGMLRPSSNSISEVTTQHFNVGQTDVKTMFFF